MPVFYRRIVVLIGITLFAVGGKARAAELTIDTPMSPPTWALLERELFKANDAACREYFARYFDDRGFLECVERWGGDDGPDDAIENLTDWPLLHMLGDDGWYDFQAKTWDHGALEVAYWSMQPDDLARVGSNPWVAYLSGKNVDYPESALRADLARIRQRVTTMREDTTTPDTRLSDDPMKFNPCSIDSLLHLACGGLPVPLGSALHTRLRYFDPQHRRPGLPADVAALIDRLTADEVRVTLVNVHQTEPRTVIVQAGAYGEHQIESLSLNGASHSIKDRRTAVRLAPGCGGSLVLKTKRFQNRPRFD